MRAKPNALGSTPLPTPIELTALELMRSIRKTTRTSPVPPVGYTVSWLSGTHYGSRA